MKIIKIINSCFECEYKDHSGAFTPGGAKHICGHSDACIKRKVTFDKYHWRQRIISESGRIPPWCPLKSPAVKI